MIARTDALSAKMIDSNIDPVDHPYILGVVDPRHPKNLMTFPKAGKQAIMERFKGEQRELKLKQWEKCMDMSHDEAMTYARQLGFSFYFDWEASRTIEGFYQVDGNVEYCARRAREYLKVADSLWMEVPKPGLAQARRLSELVKKYHPEKILSYNLSPSFNWSAAGMNNEEI